MEYIFFHQDAEQNDNYGKFEGKRSRTLCLSWKSKIKNHVLLPGVRFQNYDFKII